LAKLKIGADLTDISIFKSASVEGTSRIHTRSQPMDIPGDQWWGCNKP